MVHYDLFSEEVDLLEAVELYNILNQDIVIEASIAGMKITKENLEDEAFVKGLIKKIKNYKYDKKEPNEVQKKLNSLLGIILIISTLTIVLIPVVLLISIICLQFSAESRSRRDLEKLDQCLDKTIKKLEKQKAKSKDKEKYEEAIQKLESNRELIYNRTKVLSVIDSIDASKYNGSDIKIGNVRFTTFAGILLNSSLRNLDEYLKNLGKTLKEWERKKITLNNFDYIEQFAHYNIDNNKLLKLIEESPYKGDANETLFGGYDEEYLLSPKFKEIYKKTLTLVYEDGDTRITYIVYCHEDKCCYAINFDYESIDKITIQQLLQVSKIAYNDMIKLIKEYDKK